jgi:hypothetical protein
MACQAEGAEIELVCVLANGKISATSYVSVTSANLTVDIDHKGVSDGIQTSYKLSFKEGRRAKLYSDIVISSSTNNLGADLLKRAFSEGNKEVLQFVSIDQKKIVFGFIDSDNDRQATSIDRTTGQQIMPNGAAQQCDLSKPKF